jgi:precorrin-4/cobalt-precorrin-4 C11-methyltransferase
MNRKLESGSSLCLFIITIFITMLASAVPTSAQNPTPLKGRLCLISMGAGDRDNITVRAQKTVLAADVVLTGKQLRRKFADLLQGKEVHEIGHALFKKNCPHHRKNPAAFEPKERETRRLVREAVASGKTVAVLDSGDPTIYGAHIGFLSEFADFDPEVVPGLSSFNAANAALRRGVTGGIASRSVILTGGIGAIGGFNCKDTLSKLGETQSTMIFFTMRMKLPQVVKGLKLNYPGDTPVAIVCHAGYHDKEKVISATLDTILDTTKDMELPFEHLIYVGDFLK